MLNFINLLINLDVKLEFIIMNFIDLTIIYTSFIPLPVHICIPIETYCFLSRYV